MRRHTPNYYPSFRCLGGACPHTCCAWWEVPVDEESEAFYRTVPGALGEALRTALTADEEGETCFRLTQAGCPFLTEDRLCSLQLKWGEGKIPAICREHPRFEYDYGAVTEQGLCASCPEAARLVLETEFTLHTEQLPGEGEVCDPLLEPLLSARETALALLYADAPLTEKLRGILLLGNDLQNLLDEGEEDLSDVCQVYEELPEWEPEDLPHRREALSKVLTCLMELEHLQTGWTGLLKDALVRLEAGEELPLPPEQEGGRMAAYFLYRHWLRALNDGDLLTWCELAVLGTAVSAALAPLLTEGLRESFRQFCLEIEHAQDNLDALQDALWHRLTLADLLVLAG